MLYFFILRDGARDTPKDEESEGKKRNIIIVLFILYECKYYKPINLSSKAIRQKKTGQYVIYTFIYLKISDSGEVVSCLRNFRS